MKKITAAAKKTYQFLGIVTVLIILDRITKEIVLANLTQVIVLIPKILSLQLVFNNGVAFGLFQNAPYIIEAFTGIIILSSLYALPRIPKQYVIPMAVIIGGAAGNFVDRIIYTQGVVDFIAVRFFSIFNLADIAISTGVVWILIIMVLEDKADKKKQSKKKK